MIHVDVDSSLAGCACAVEWDVERTVEERNALALRFLPLVKFVVNRIAARLPAHVETDDLFNAGVLGLIDAIEKFDATRSIRFKTYAEFRIRGAILDDLRALDWASRSMRQKAHRLEKAYAELEGRLGRPASDHEMVEYMNITYEEYDNLIREVNGISLISLDELRYGNDDDGACNLLDYLTDPNALDPAVALNLDQVYRLVADAIDRLPTKERLVISLYYNDELSMKEIGKVLSITESRVSQIHAKAILRLRSRLVPAIQM